VGADGLIRSEQAGGGAVTFGLVNADGGSAEMSGNGARCLGLAAARAGWWDDRSRPLVLRTPVGERRLDWQSGDLEEARLRTAMGDVRSWRDPPDRGRDLAGYAANGASQRWLVSVGNPHAVALLDAMPPREDLEEALAKIEPGGPADVNYEFVVRGPGTDSVTMVVRERGAGWTEACGTGSVAAAWAAHQQGWVGQRVEVHNPGGPVQVELSGSEAWLSGPAIFVASVEVNP